ncbi:MAG: hypothetical protein ACLR23_19895 [Clostridia bacterium]
MEETTPSYSIATEVYFRQRPDFAGSAPHGQDLMVDIADRVVQGRLRAIAADDCAGKALTRRRWLEPGEIGQVL